MGLPYTIEYLLTIRRPSGGHLVHMGTYQLIIDQVPPYAQFTLIGSPVGDYLVIGYSLWIDPAVPPGVFHGFGQYYGTKTYEADFTSFFTAYPMDALVFVSHAEPSVLYMRNNTPLFQYFAMGHHYVVIESEEDFMLVLKHLKGVGTDRTNALLEQLVFVRGGAQR